MNYLDRDKMNNVILSGIELTLELAYLPTPNITITPDSSSYLLSIIFSLCISLTTIRETTFGTNESVSVVYDMAGLVLFVHDVGVSSVSVMCVCKKSDKVSKVSLCRSNENLSTVQHIIIFISLP